MSDAADGGSIGLVFDESGLAGQPFFGRRLAALPALVAPPMDGEARAMACRGWEERTRSEYRGVMIVRSFHALTIEVNAPADVQELALSMTLQEQQHARLCMRAARSLGSEGEIAFDPGELSHPVQAGDLGAQLMRKLVGTYLVGEIVALDLIRHALRVLPPSGYRDVLRSIAADEVLHARIGPAILRESRAGAPWLPWPGDDAVVELGRGFVEAMRARDVIEPDEAAMFEDPRLAAQLMAAGIPPSRDFKEIHDRALVTSVPRAFERAGLRLP